MDDDMDIPDEQNYHDEYMNNEGNDKCAEDDGNDQYTKDTENEESMEEQENEDVSGEQNVQRKFVFYIKYKKWQKFAIKVSKRGDRILQGDWRNIFAKKIMNVNQTCPVVFQSHHIVKLASRKKNCPFFTAKAKCKFEGCLRYIVKIKKEPVPGTTVKVKVSIKKPFTVVKHDDEMSKGRPILGLERKKVAKLINDKGPTNVYYEKLGTTDDISLEAGNTSMHGTKSVMRKIASEHNLSNRLHSDVIVEVSLLKKVYESEDESKGCLKGHVQSISMNPFSVTLYGNLQLSLLASKISEGSAVLHFDGTGKVISNIPSQPKRVMYYPLIVKGNEPGDPPLPLAELISNSHNTVDISTFFLRLLRDLHIGYPSVGIPQRIEIDYCWAFIHAIMLAFNREDISSYLERAWNAVNSKSEWGSQTKVHICSAHVLHKISGRLAKTVNNKAAKKYILYVVARIVDCNNLEEIDKIFKSLCILLLSKYEDSHPRLGNCVSFLNKVVERDDYDLETEECDDDDTDEERESSAGTKPSESVFAVHFRHIVDEVTLNICQDQAQTNAQINVYYHPEVLSYLLNTYMCILPLWAGLLLEDGKKHDTNSPVENWMKILKQDILQRRSRLTPSNFIIAVKSTLKGRVKEYTSKTSFKIHHSTNKGTKKSKQVGKNSFSKSEERWGGKRSKKGIFFSSPIKIPKPQSARLFSDSEKKKKKLTTKKLSNALHWGGKAEFNGKVMHLSNTCPVDNLLMVMYLLLKQDHILSWFEEKKEELTVCQVLLEIKSLFDSGNWTEGRILWLNNFLEIPDGDLWDTWGSEAEMFVLHFGPIQKTKSALTCTKRKCPRVKRNFSSLEILLGDNDTTRKTCSLEDSLKQWEQAAYSPCLFNTKYGPCKGTQVSSRRTFVQEQPPILIISVSYLSQSKGLTPDKLPQEITVNDYRYTLTAYTLGDRGHFKACIFTENKWHTYDGLRRPELREVRNRDQRGTLEHVVYSIQ